MPWETTQGNHSLFDSQFPQRPGSRLIRKRMGVVVLAEVAQEDVLQPWMPEPLDGAGALIIAEVDSFLIIEGTNLVIKHQKRKNK